LHGLPKRRGRLFIGECLKEQDKELGSYLKRENKEGEGALWERTRAGIIWGMERWVWGEMYKVQGSHTILGKLLPAYVHIKCIIYSFKLTASFDIHFYHSTSFKRDYPISLQHFIIFKSHSVFN